MIVEGEVIMFAHLLTTTYFRRWTEIKTNNTVDDAILYIFYQ